MKEKSEEREPTIRRETMGDSPSAGDRRRTGMPLSIHLPASNLGQVFANGLQSFSVC